MKQILAINTGSSSIKFALFAFGPEQRRLLGGSLSGIGCAEGLFAAGPAGREAMVARARFADHDEACRQVLAWFRQAAGKGPDAIVHRMVHGGSGHTMPELLTAELLAALERLVPYAPEHLPQALRAARSAACFWPAIPQVACFDTAFHRSMPEVARRYPLPAEYALRGVRRYGFHGLSYQSVVDELELLEPGSSRGRLLLAHLGQGASMAAVLDGSSIDTTMGFSPAGGMMMGSRSGDLDPGVVLFLLREEEGRDAAWLDELVNRRSGLLGVSALSCDMRVLLKAEADGNRIAAEAVELFCYQAVRHAGALVAVLGGLDALVFTGGIGEHAPAIRERICRGLASMGVVLDAARNARGEALVSSPESRVLVRVVAAAEEKRMAFEAFRLLGTQGVWESAGSCRRGSG